MLEWFYDKQDGWYMRSADESLAGLGRKAATATKLGNYTTYSPQISIHIIACCSTFCKPLKKNSVFVCPTRSPRQQWPLCRMKNGKLAIDFQSREEVVFWRGQIWRIGWVIKMLGAQVGQFVVGCKCPVSQGIVMQEQDPLDDLPAAFFLQNVLQMHQQRWVILRIDSLALWKIINEEDAVLIPKNIGEKFSSGFLQSEFLGAGWATMPPLHWLLLCLRVIVI